MNGSRTRCNKKFYTISTLEHVKTTHLTQESIVFLDLDETLFTASHKVMRRINKQHREDFLRSLGRKHLKDIAESSRRMLIEDYSQKFILDCPCPCYGFTARRTGFEKFLDQYSTEELTHRTLKSLGISFTSCENRILRVPLKTPSLESFKTTYRHPGQVRLYNNVIYTNNLDKGVVLICYLRTLNYMPDIIVLVDDQYNNLVSFAREIEKYNQETGANIKFEGYLYSGSERMDNNINQIALRWQELSIRETGIFISDSAAMSLLEYVNKDLLDYRTIFSLLASNDI